MERYQLTTLHKPRFRRRRLVLLVSATFFINACTNLQRHDSTPDTTGTTDTTAQANRIHDNTARRAAPRISREAPSPAVTVELREEEIAFQNSVWFRVSEGLEFYHLYFNDEIAEELDWFKANPEFMRHVSERAAPFIYEIVMEIERRKLPMELALLPVIESAYMPAARSGVDAAGLWQFMAPTASSLGLDRNWWYDGRHDPIASTHAALDYLERLYAQFYQDWLMALAAYNAGQGTVSRAIRRNQSRDIRTDFWSLPLPRETLRHVPRLLGLAYAMADPLGNGLTLNMTPHSPWLAQVAAGSQIDLTLAAQLAGLEPETIFELNPGYLQWATHPNGPHLINLPIAAAAKFETELADLGNARITWDRYVIKPGDTLGGIAKTHQTQVSVLQQTNNIRGSRIIAGESLLIPRAYQAGDPLPNGLAMAAGEPTPDTVGVYTVRRGDNLWRIANRYQLTVAELQQWNNLTPDALLMPGQQLVLKPPGQSQASIFQGGF